MYLEFQTFPDIRDHRHYAGRSACIKNTHMHRKFGRSGSSFELRCQVSPRLVHKPRRSGNAMSRLEECESSIRYCRKAHEHQAQKYVLMLSFQAPFYDGWTSLSVSSSSSTSSARKRTTVGITVKDVYMHSISTHNTLQEEIQRNPQ